MKQSISIPKGRFAGEEYEQYDEQPLKRNAFVTFWLWLGIIVNVLYPVLAWLGAQDMDFTIRRIRSYGSQFIDVANQFENAYSIMLWCTVIGAICYFIGYLNLLAWRKKGFVVIVVASIILSCVNIYAIGMISDAAGTVGVLVDTSLLYVQQVAFSVISWIILWAILQLKKNGISCWSQLD